MGDSSIRNPTAACVPYRLSGGLGGSLAWPCSASRSSGLTRLLANCDALPSSVRHSLLGPSRVVLPSCPQARAAADAVIERGLAALLRWARAALVADSETGPAEDVAGGRAALDAADAAAGRLPDGSVRLRRAVAGDQATVQVGAARVARS